MKINKKIIQKIKNNIPGFIIGILTCSVVGVAAATFFPSNNVTYDNTESGLNSTDVQGAIDELYNACKTPAEPPTIPVDQIIEDAGLTKDEYECRYFFTGANPNNYITFNDEKAGWRIISVECDGRIKIMREASIESLAWDTSNNNNWARPATLNTYLNETYYYYLYPSARSQIITSNFSIGKIISNNNSLITQINNENGTKWKGNIALPTASEYIRTNSDKSRCGTFQLINKNKCTSTGWMDTNDVWWTLAAMSGYNDGACRIWGTDGNFNCDSVKVENSIRPTLYLSSEIKITSGTGTKKNPYQISL